MKYKTAFRMALKVVGVWAVIDSAYNLAAAGAWMVWLLARGQLGLGPFPSQSVLGLAPYALQVALGLYLFFGGKWLANLAIPGNRPYCPECG